MAYIMNKLNDKDSNVLTFTLQNVNVSFANAIRRTVLSDIDTVGLKTEPYEQNQMTIYKNTTSLNNEIIKHRMACIPIHLTDLSQDLSSFIVEINMKNNTDNVMLVTTNDIKVKDSKTNVYMDETERQRLFPVDTITKDPIIIAKLQPIITDISNVPGGYLHLECPMSICKARESGVYNVVSTCSYGNTPDEIKQKTVWDETKKKLVKDGDDNLDIEQEEKNWRLLDGKRVYIPDSFDFIVETVGVFENDDIIRKACMVLMKRITNFQSLVDSGKLDIKNGNTIRPSFDVIVPDDNYTIGKLIEYALYTNYYENTKTLSFIGYNKPHPHSTYGVIRMMFHNPDYGIENVSGILSPSIQTVITTIQNIQKQI